MGNGNGTKTQRQLVKEAETVLLREGSPAVLAAEHKEVERIWGETKQDKAIILDSLSELVIFQDLEHRVLWANKVAGESVGIASKKLVGRYCYDIWCNGAKPCDGCPVEKARLTGKPQAGEMTTPDGKVWLVKGYPITNARGDVTGLVEMTLEITERKWAEDALQEERNKLQSVVSAMEDGLTIQDKDFNIIYLNETLKKDYGDCVGEKCYHVYENRDEVCDGCPVKKAFKDGKSHTSERKVVLPSGEIAFGENTASPVRDAQGKIISCIEINRDVTERKQAEEKFQEEKNKLQSVVDAIEYGITIQDRDFNIIYQNEQAKKPFGERIGEKCYRAYSGKEQVCDGCPVAKAFKDGKSHTDVRPNISPSGKVTYWENTASPIKDAKGNIVSCLEITRDITKRKRVEEELQEEKNKLQSLISAMEFTLTIQDRDFNIIYQNEASQLTSAGSRVGEKCYRVYEGRDTICDGCPLKKAFKDGKSHSSERRRIEPSGKVSYWENTASPIRDANGKIVSCLEIGVDITERKKAEEALRESEARYRAVIEGAYDMIQSVDLDGRIIFVNKAWRDTLGYTEAELSNLKFTDIIHPDYMAHCQEMFEKVAKGQSVLVEEVVFLAKDGRKVLIEGNAAPRYVGDRVVASQGIFRDITERRKAEQALADELTRRRILVEQSRDGIVVLDEKGKVYEANQKFAEMLGYTYEEAQELNVWDWEFLFPREQVAEMIRTVDETGDHFETRHRRKDGTTFDVEISTNAATVSGQKLIFCVCRDITERKKADEALAEAEKKYKSLVEATSDITWEADTEGRYTFISPNIKELLGYEVDEVVGKKRTLDFTPRKELKRWLKRFKAVNAKRESFSGFEVLHLHKNGKLLIFEVSGIPFFDSAGNFKGYVGINKDVTERKQMTEALRESQKFSTGLMENSPNPKSVLNPDTSIKYVNPALEKLTGYKLTEIADMKAPYPWWPKEESRAMTINLKKAMFSGGKKSEKVFVKKNGERFWVALNSAPVIYRKKLRYFLISWLDITDRKRAEEEKAELEQKAHLASRLASVGEMASGIAHEINNPLTAVIGFSQLLMDNELPKDIREDLVIIHKEAQRAAGVARNLLTFARKHSPSKQLTSVNSIIEGVLSLRAYEQNVSNIQIHTKLAPDLPDVMADYSQLQQVFINIILNAESAMLEANNGGTLTITTQTFNNSVRASFADNGPGIDKENLNRIFDPFFTTKEVGKGTGLGLSVCHGIIAEHGGKIYAKSRPGSGATFVVELPISPQGQQEEPNEPT